MGKLPLEGIRIVDFSWFLAGPSTTRYLADMGAVDFKIESHRRLDGHRTFGPWKNLEPSAEYGGGYFHRHNRNKMSITLNLSDPRGIDIVKKLVKVSDIVIENYSPQVMKKFGLDYSVLRGVNPRIIMASLSGYGQFGPYHQYTSFGPGLQFAAGDAFTTGYRGGRPLRVGSPTPDYTGGLHGVVTILAALEYRRKTGKGQYIDLSQHETVVSSVIPLPVIDYLVNKRIAQRVANFHLYAAPHGCYQCKGDERWCVIAVFTDEEWESFCRVLGNPAWTKEPKFVTLPDRVKNVEELDRLVEGWTLNLSPEEVMKKMQGAGVAAGVVENAQDLIERDPHLKERGFYANVEHPVMGTTIFEGLLAKFSETPGSIRTPAPLLGEHTDYVMKEILSMPQEEVDQLRAEGVLD